MRENGEIKLRLILDRFSAEIFVNDGEHVMTATIYTDLEADGISFFADGKWRTRDFPRKSARSRQEKPWSL